MSSQLIFILPIHMNSNVSEPFPENMNNIIIHINMLSIEIKKI